MSDIAQPTFIFNMGDRVKDVVSGYEGIVMARFEYWTGCNHYGVEGQAQVGTKLPYESFDEQRLEVVQSNAVRLARDYKAEPASRRSPDAAAPRDPHRPA